MPRAGLLLLGGAVLFGGYGVMLHGLWNLQGRGVGLTDLFRFHFTLGAAKVSPGSSGGGGGAGTGNFSGGGGAGGGGTGGGVG
jgi:hypothetical protein